MTKNSIDTKRKPYKFQERAIAFAKSRNRSALFLEAGLGKTLVSLRSISTVRKLLIVAPAFLIPNWKSELEEEGICRKSYVIMSYNKLLDTDIPVGVFDSLILDESHYIKTISSQRTAKILEIHKYIKNIIFLTGTPYTKSASDLYTTLAICEPGKWGSYKEFCDKYCYDKYNTFKKITEAVGLKNREELFALMNTATLTIKKEDVLDDLPEVRESVLRLESNIDVSYHPEELADRESMHIAEVRKLSASIKVSPYVGSLKDRNINRGIIFVWHKEIGYELERNIDGSVFLCGDHSIEERYSEIDWFQLGKTDFLILSIAACGVGLNITNADYVGFFEIPFTYAEIDQAISRAHRIGNHHESIFVEYVILNGSIDEALYQIAMRRGGEADSIIVGDARG